MGSKERHQAGREARLHAEVNHSMNGWPVQYSCIYRRIEQANQFKRGWDRVSQVDINVAIHAAINAAISQNISLNALSFGNNKNIY
jgi:hypothetical protein